MRYRILGKTGLKVSEVGFGCIPIIRLSMDEAVRVLRRAQERGITLFDTANVYLDSEEKMAGPFRGCAAAIGPGHQEHEAGPPGVGSRPGAKPAAAEDRLPGPVSISPGLPGGGFPGPDRAGRAFGGGAAGAGGRKDPAPRGHLP